MVKLIWAFTQLEFKFSKTLEKKMWITFFVSIGYNTCFNMASEIGRFIIIPHIVIGRLCMPDLRRNACRIVSDSWKLCRVAKDVCCFSLFYFRNSFFFKEKFQGQIWISLEAWKQDQCQRNVIRKLMNRVMAILIQDLEESCFHYLKKLIIYSLKNERITQSK